MLLIDFSVHVCVHFFIVYIYEVSEMVHGCGWTARQIFPLAKMGHGWFSLGHVRIWCPAGFRPIAWQVHAHPYLEPPCWSVYCVWVWRGELRARLLLVLQYSQTQHAHIRVFTETQHREEVW